MICMITRITDNEVKKLFNIMGNYINPSERNLFLPLKIEGVEIIEIARKLGILPENVPVRPIQKDYENPFVYDAKDETAYTRIKLLRDLPPADTAVYVEDRCKSGRTTVGFVIDAIRSGYKPLTFVIEDETPEGITTGSVYPKNRRHTPIISYIQQNYPNTYEQLVKEGLVVPEDRHLIYGQAITPNPPWRMSSFHPRRASNPRSKHVDLHLVGIW